MPELPSELERDIFELAFESSNRDLTFKLTLCLVARRVHLWIDQLFYRMLSLADNQRATRFLRVIQANLKPAGFFAAVKNLCLTYYVMGTTACQILAACTDVESLACWIDSEDTPQLPLLIGRLPLRRLSIEADHFSRIPVTPSTWLSSLTHIELVPWGKNDYLASTLSRLAHLPCLTHVSLGAAHMNGELVGLVCSSCPHLQVLLLRSSSDDREFSDEDSIPNLYRKLNLQESAHDYRIIMQRDPKGFDHVENWEAAYFARSDMWSHAEVTMEEQKALSIRNV
ncbi:Zn(2)-C6 fungal-type domain-containing protein [Mycena venus]|uniref:Zn(2)-C6 fungal-type domain-containing protein n=1 Tax=Mycena venus TaxID=2733690 RepID=A0A8H7CYE3_9AGAR|nr:Zn(2)-C6 fungal-type domain-containing protein [Mycena venus]